MLRRKNSTERKRVASIAQLSSWAVIPGETCGKGVNTGSGRPQQLPPPCAGTCGTGTFSGQLNRFTSSALHLRGAREGGGVWSSVEPGGKRRWKFRWAGFGPGG